MAGQPRLKGANVDDNDANCHRPLYPRGKEFDGGKANQLQREAQYHKTHRRQQVTITDLKDARAAGRGDATNGSRS